MVEERVENNEGLWNSDGVQYFPLASHVSSNEIQCPLHRSLRPCMIQLLATPDLIFSKSLPFSAPVTLVNLLFLELTICSFLSLDPCIDSSLFCDSLPLDISVLYSHL